jgi:hypothetical protein
MKKLCILILFVMALGGCTESNEFGKCIGITEKPDPKLEYKYDGWNIALGIIFSETIVVPLVVVFDSLKCPYAINPINSTKKEGI